MWNSKTGYISDVALKLNSVVKENVRMASKKASVHEKGKPIRKGFFQRSESTLADNGKHLNASTDDVDSQSSDSDSKKVFRRSSMICSEGFDKYTFDSHRAEIYLSDVDSQKTSSDHNQNLFVFDQNSLSNSRSSKFASTEQSAKKPVFLKPLQIPTISVKNVSVPFKRISEETVLSNTSPSYKRVPEETIPAAKFPLLNTTAEKSSVTNIPLSFSPTPEQSHCIDKSSAKNPLNSSAPVKSSPFTFKSNVESPIRSSPISLKVIPEEKTFDKITVERNIVPHTNRKYPLSVKQVVDNPIPERSNPLSFEKLKKVQEYESAQNVSDMFVTHRTKPLSLNNYPGKNVSQTASMHAHELENHALAVRNSPLTFHPVAEEKNIIRNSLLFKDIPEEPIPYRNSPLSLKPVLTKPLSILKRKTSSIKSNIKRDSVVHPGRIDVQTSLCIDGRFQNPWPTWRPPTFTNILKFGVTRNKSKVPPKQELDLILPIVKQNFSKLTMPDDGIRVTWIGHSTVLLQMHGLNILTDPIFSERASPSQVVGPKRYRDPPCSIHDLPPINAVVISHSHYDHLDYNTVTLLNARFGSELRWFVPLGLQTWMEDVGCENVVQLDWWEENCVPEHSDTFFVFTPAQHWSKRTIGDDNKVLWGSWCILGPKYKFFFAGDTGYCEAFKQIGRVHGPFDLSAIPIGAYEPRWFMKYQHINPEESVKIHMDVRSKKSLAIHWGTFCLANEYYLDPPVKLREGLEKYDILPELFFTLKHGESKLIDHHVLVKKSSDG